MERLYNPSLMSEDEIKKTFVGRQPIIDDLMSVIEHQPEGAGVQHAVIVAPRGMGKTTLLLLTGYAVKDRDLAPPWQVVHFPEESYNIYDLADLWLTVLETVAIDTNDPALQIRSNRLKTEFPKSDDLQEAALALIKDWCRQNNRRLLLLIDNFDMVLSVFNDEQQSASLRNTLMNDGTMMIVGGATSFFKEARDYNQPLYNFFKIYHLDKLKLEDIQNLLRQRASLDGDGNFEEALKTNASRIRTLEYFTFGNPRLVLMLYRIITQSEVLEVRRGLEKLLDEVTPYYKAKTENLPAQQRKILDHIARITSQTNEGQTPKEIAEAVRMTPNLVSSQLKRLLDDGYVRVANLRGRSTYYTLSEPLYSIWYQMRFGRDARERIQVMADFLEGFYDGEVKPTRVREKATTAYPFNLEPSSTPTMLMTIVSEQGYRIARNRISDLGLDLTYFPLARALDYVITNDEALIEKLSPEIRNIVDEIVVKLHKANKNSPLADNSSVNDLA